MPKSNSATNCQSRRALQTALSTGLCASTAAMTNINQMIRDRDAHAAPRLSELSERLRELSALCVQTRAAFESEIA